MGETQVHFPDPNDPERYDEEISQGSGAGLCQAVVGINGHLAFNEASSVDVNGNPHFPVTLLHTHKDTAYTVTADVVEVPRFVLA